MRLKPIDIGGLKTENNVFLAPLAGYTNAVFRSMCFKLGAGLTFTEMVSAKGLCYDSAKTRDLLKLPPEYSGINACQLFGNDPEIMRRAAESGELENYPLIDINMGCPVPKIYKNGEGSALLNNFPLAAEIISECKKSGKRISVKFRIGLDNSSICGVEFAKNCADAGADMICVHGRTRDKMYSGEVNFNEIAKIKQAVNIPVIANGGVFSKSDADLLMERTGADGVEVARGALYAPWIFSEICGISFNERKKAVKNQLDLTFEYYDYKFALVFMRKMIAFYTRGIENASKYKERLYKCASKEQIEEILSELSI